MFENFFKGEEASDEKVRKIIQSMSIEDATFNIIGEKSINLALEEGIIKEKSVGRINGIPFALVLS